jgi:hypothetical protein
MVRFDVRKIVVLLLLAAPAVQAQLWSGPAAVEVRAQDQKGLPVAGAEVKLQFTDLDPKDGPPPVTTDARGNATVGGLAEGSWIVEVSHEGFMTYMAEINVRAGGRPTVGLATQVNVPGALRTMRVEISRGRAARVPAPPRPPGDDRPAAAPPPSPAPPAEAGPSSEPAAEARPPEARPAPAPPPVPAPPVTEAAPEVTPPTLSAPEPPRNPPVAPQPAQPPAPADPVRLRTAKDRTCFECPPGESALSTERVVPPGGGPGCGTDVAARLQGGQVPPDLAPGCHVLRLTLPAGARYTGYRYEVQDGRESLDCLSGRDCPQGTGRWPSDPVLIRGPRETVLLAPFESGPAQRERRAVFTVYFTTGIAKRQR